MYNKKCKLEKLSDSKEPIHINIEIGYEVTGTIAREPLVGGSLVVAHDGHAFITSQIQEIKKDGDAMLLHTFNSIYKLTILE